MAVPYSTSLGMVKNFSGRAEIGPDVGMGPKTVIVQDVSVFFGTGDILGNAEVYFSMGDSKFIVNITSGNADVWVSGVVLTGLPTMYAIDPDQEIIIGHAFASSLITPGIFPWVTGFHNEKHTYIVPA